MAEMLVPYEKSSSVYRELRFDHAVIQEANSMIRIHLICCYSFFESVTATQPRERREVN
jgi:hypothetical protein